MTELSLISTFNSKIASAFPSGLTAVFIGGTSGVATADGLPLTAALGIHTRICFIQNLLPLIQRAKGLKRVVTVGAATCEGDIDLDNILAVGVPLLQFRDQLASVMTLALEQLSEEAPDVSFVHTCPGVVDSGIARDAEGFSLKVMLLVSSLFKPLGPHLRPNVERDTSLLQQAEFIHREKGDQTLPQSNLKVYLWLEAVQGR
ncbi:hypothetical protein ACHAQJ_001670 [Trichoderma viride]